jgi:signal transduction histidine kinase
MKLTWGKKVLIGAGLTALVAEFARKAGQSIKKLHTLELVVEEKKEELEQTNIALKEEIAERKNAEKQLVTMNMQLRKLSSHLHSIREEERKRISREIHDVLGQQLTVLKMDLSWINKRTKDDTTGLKAKLDEMMNTINETLKTVKKISFDLRPGTLDDLGLIATIEFYCSEFEKRSGIKCVFNTNEEHIDINPDAATAIFRIFQETLTNVMRHAEATLVTVSIECIKKHLELTITDNGKGVKIEEMNHLRSLGILGMKERAADFGGVLFINPGIEKGTTVKLITPL